MHNAPMVPWRTPFSVNTIAHALMQCLLYGTRVYTHTLPDLCRCKTCTQPLIWNVDGEMIFSDCFFRLRKRERRKRFFWFHREKTLSVAHLSLSRLIGEVIHSIGRLCRLLFVRCPHSSNISSEIAGPIKAKFHMEPSGIGEGKFVQMIRVVWPRWPPCP